MSEAIQRAKTECDFLDFGFSFILLLHANCEFVT